MASSVGVNFVSPLCMHSAVVLRNQTNLLLYTGQNLTIRVWDQITTNNFYHA